MTRLVHYLTHPQVRIEPERSVPRWSLSDLGRRRTEALAASGRLAGVDRLIASDETKAVETADILAAALGLSVEIDPALHENDRSATGFLPPDRFEAMADRFFAEPERAVEGWERAVDAEARVVRALGARLGDGRGARVLVVGHGAVGTLLACRLAGWPIDRSRDQPAGGGSVFTADWDAGRLLHAWTPMENFDAATHQGR